MAVCRYMLTCPKWPECRHGGFTVRDTLLPGSQKKLHGVLGTASILYLRWALRHLYFRLTLYAFSLCVLTFPPLLSAPTQSPPSSPVSTWQRPPGSATESPVQTTIISGLTPATLAMPPGTQPTLPTHNHPAPLDPTTACPQTYPTLTFSSLNVGGVEITPNRLCHLLGGYGQLSHTFYLQVYRSSLLSTARDHERIAPYWGYRLLMRSPSSKEGVALLVHTSVAPTTPAMKIHIPGRLISVSLCSSRCLVTPSYLKSMYVPSTAPTFQRSVLDVRRPLRLSCKPAQKFGGPQWAHSEYQHHSHTA